MAKWANALVLDGGTDLIRTRAGTADRVKMHVLKAYSTGDSYATAISNSCGSISMAAGDLVQSSSGSNRRMTVAAKDIALTANSGASPDVHVALLDEVASAVLLATDETNNQQLYSGNTFAGPAWTYDVNQPT